MAAKLQCEICGGELIGRPGGIFECDSCGMKFDTAWAKAKIQEIQGTVKVEGTVEVQGTVKVEGTANKESLLKRGYLALEDGQWETAKRFFNEALNADAENAEAYLCLALANERIKSEEEIADLDDNGRIASLESSSDYLRFTRFASEERKASLCTLLEKARHCAAKQERVEAEKRTALEHRLSEAKEQQKQVLASARERLQLCRRLIAAGSSHTVGVQSNGRVLATGSNIDSIYGGKGQCNTGGWRNIVAVAVGSKHTVGLHPDGTVVAVGNNDSFQCNVSGWTNSLTQQYSKSWEEIIDISAGGQFTIGLKINGLVVATGSNYQGQCGVSDWIDIVGIAAGGGHTLGLRNDGTVIATKLVLNAYVRDYGQCNVSGWADIVAIAAGDSHSLGLRSDGTLAAAGLNNYGQCDVGEWKNIVAVSAGLYHTVGLYQDGTVVATGFNEDGRCNVSEWEDIVAISAGNDYTVGLRSDGSMVAVGANQYGQCNVSGWKLFRNMDTMQDERITALQDEFASLKGVFSSKRRKEIEIMIEKYKEEINKQNH